ncbi:MAG: hypothetical protein H0W98_01960 [Chloroflexi bacterium]|nr:hypothetical protein [Chloroflexota bacterium]
MADPKSRPATADPDRDTADAPRWVRVLAVTVIIVILLVVVMMLLGGGGGHRPPATH